MFAATLGVDEVVAGTVPVVAGYAYTTLASTGNVSLPSGIQSGELLVMISSVASDSAEPLAPPSGWSLLGSVTTQLTYVFTRVADGSEGASLASGCAKASGHLVLRVSGYLASTLAIGAWSTNTNTATISAASMTAVDSSLLIAAYTLRSTTNHTVSSAPSGMDLIYFGHTAATCEASSNAWSQTVNASSTGARTLVLNTATAGSRNASHGVLLNIK